MIAMATIKHISSKSSDYSAAESYLIFQHDEYRNIPVLDEQGKKILRSEFLIQTAECGEEDYAMACIRANRKFGVNDQRNDVKSHHYIISFDPRDKEDNGLTMEKAQKLGMEFCKKHFPGHPAIVATHPDGHNASGNIHVHIVINSLRIRDVERLPFMEKPCDWEAGKKHRCTSAMLRYLRSEVMEMCTEAGLYQIDLLHGSREKITEREYWAQKRGQRRLEDENAKCAAAGEPPKKTRYETDKAILRKQIRAALKKAGSLEEFSAILLQEYGVALRESRGRFSYLTAERTKAISSRKLGEDFGKEAILAAIEANAKRRPDANILHLPTVTMEEFLNRPGMTMDDLLKKSNGFTYQIDIEKGLAHGKGQGFANWAGTHNVKQLAKAIAEAHSRGIYQEQDLLSCMNTAQADSAENLRVVKDLEGQIADIRELSKYISDYQQTRDTAKAVRTAKNPAAFRKAHQHELALHDAAVSYFRDHGISRLPNLKTLQKKREDLICQKTDAYERYREARSELERLRKIQSNLETVFSRAHSGKKQEAL